MKKHKHAGVNIDISKVHTRKVVPEVLLNENWYEHQEVFSDQIDYDWHCPETGMIFATYQEKTNGDSALTIYHTSFFHSATTPSPNAN